MNSSAVYNTTRGHQDAAARGRRVCSEQSGGGVVKRAGGRVETVLDGLKPPQGLAVRNGLLYAVDVVAKEVIEYGPASGKRRVVAAQRPWARLRAWCPGSCAASATCPAR